MQEKLNIGTYISASLVKEIRKKGYYALFVIMYKNRDQSAKIHETAQILCKL